MIKKSIYVSALVLSFVIFATGCTNDQTARNNTPGTTDSNIAQGITTTPLGLNNDMNSTNYNPLGTNTGNESTMLESRINQISGVSNSKVVVRNTTAYIALRTDNTGRGMNMDTIRNTIVSILRENTSTIRTAYILTDDNAYSRLSNMSTNITGTVGTTGTTNNVTGTGTSNTSNTDFEDIVMNSQPITVR